MPTPRQSALLQFHCDTASLLTGRNEVFWILDLEDPVAHTIARVIQGKTTGTDEATSKADVDTARDNIRATDCVPAMTSTTSLEQAQTTFFQGWGIEKKLPPGRYFALVSDGKLLIAAMPDFTATPIKNTTQTQNPNQNYHGRN